MEKNINFVIFQVLGTTAVINEYIYAMITIVFSIILIYILSKLTEVSPGWPTFGYLLVIVYIMLDLQMNIAPAAPDMGMFHSLAVATQENWLLPNTNNAIDYLNPRVKSYVLFVAAVYFMTTDSILLGGLANASLWGLSIVLWMGTYRNLFSYESNYFGALLVTYPTVIRYSSRLLREAITLFAIAVSIYYLSRWWKQGKRGDLVGVGAGFFGTFLFRPEICILLIISFGSYLIAEQLINKNSRNGILGGSFISVILILYVQLTGGRFTSFYRIDVLERVRRSRTFGPTAYLESMSYQGVSDILLYLPIRIYYFLYFPPPWSMLTYFHAAVDSLYWMVLTPFLIIGLSSFSLSRKNRYVLFFIIFTALIIIGHSLVVGNFAATSRRKLFAFPAAALITSHIMEQHFGRIKLKIRRIRS